MRRIKRLLEKAGFSSAAILLVLTLGVADLVVLQHADAAPITSRSLKISSSANGSIDDGSPGDGGDGLKAKYTFSFTVPTSGAIQSVLFEFCTTPLAGTTCTSPTGMDASHLSGATLTTTGTNFTTGFSEDHTTVLTGAPYNCTGASPGRTNCFAITRTSASSVSGALTVTFTVDSSHYVTNPTPDNYTFFGRMVTYSDTSYATPVDSGTVANSTAKQIFITSKVQEVLNFSVGSTPTDPAGTTCAPFTDSGAVTLGDPTNGVLSFTQAYDAHSYFRVQTNANSGTLIYYSGDTLKHGTDSIAATGTVQPTPSTAVASAVGTSQYGLAIDSSDTQAGFGYSFTSLAATAPYAAGNGTITNGGSALFAEAPSSVTTPVQIAGTANTIVCDTGSVRYLGNISTTVPPGVYTTTVTYIALPTY